MIYYCKDKSTSTKVICVILLVITLICGIFSAFDVGIRGVFEMLTFASAIAVIQISQRYVMASLEYILDPHEEIAVYNRLTVIKTVGKKRISLATISLRSLTEVVPYKKQSELVAEYGEISQKINFCMNMFPKESFVLLFEVNDALTAVRLECDKNFADELKKRAGV